jgi:2-keto-4-pentenoate hydratase/2-oxohepta-3-ene-1,7-dioic acid hydratase in catechol pathway
MKLATFNHDGQTRVGVVMDQVIADLTEGPSGLVRLQDVSRFGANWHGALAALAQNAPRIPLSEVRLRQPIIRPGKILGIGLNYRDHAEETGRPTPTTQTWFVKQATAAHGPFDPVLLPVVSNQLDYEAELVVVIGRHGRFVPAERAHEIIAGVCCGCDYSVRDWQRATPTMIMGKGFDTHAPFGPWITTLDEVGDIAGLGVRSFVNGEQRQNGRAGDMVFTIGQQIAHLSAAFTLEPGDVIFTGTPAGVGVASTPPRFVKAGDTVRVEIDGLGAIEQTIVDEQKVTRIG